MTVLECFRQGLSGSLEEHTSQLLSYQMFQFEEFHLLCKGLSPGQHRKLMIAKLMASKANLLLLDEPTNHISFDILEEFERALGEFPGAIIAVSHDRRFMQQFRGAVWTLTEGELIPPPDHFLTRVDTDRITAEIQELAKYTDSRTGQHTDSFLTEGK